MLDTPILLLVFNRPDTTEKVFQQIRKAQPKQLFIAADGARENKESEKEKCEVVRKLILANIDWQCDVKTLFRDENLGCGLGPANAIMWFFENVEYGIILEDDCLPDLSFFRFCEELLVKYKDEESVFSISGMRYYPKKFESGNSYEFTNLNGIWGWATWRRAWKYYNFYMKDFENFEKNDQLINRVFFDEEEKLNDIARFRSFVNNIKNDIWDIQWEFSHRYHEGLCINPSVNLVSNIGFGDDATHTFYKYHPLANLQSQPIDFPLIHPKVARNVYLEEQIILKRRKLKSKEPFFLKILNKIRVMKKNILNLLKPTNNKKG